MSTSQTHINVVKWADLRPMIAFMKKNGCTLSVNKPGHKHVLMPDGSKILSALRYSGGQWSVHTEIDKLESLFTSNK